MSQPGNANSRWIVSALVILAAMAVGWYIGSRAGGDADAPTDAQHESAGEVHRDVAGRVVRVDVQEGVLTVDHEEIPGFMAAMVMDLNVADAAELQGLEADDEIVFDLARIGDTYKAVRIRHADDAEGSNPNITANEPIDPLGPGDLVPDLVLFDTEGHRFRLREMEPRHKIITFFYVRCPLQHFCPAQSQRLAQLQQHMEESQSGTHLVSLTLDAEHDRPEVLAGYAERFEADPARWTLAGSDDPEAIRQFAHRAGARLALHEGSYEIDHALIALRIDGDRIVDRVYGLESIEKLIHGM